MKICINFIAAFSIVFSASVFANSEACIADVEKFKKDCYTSSLGCASHGPGGLSRCQQACDEKYMQYKLNCYAMDRNQKRNQPATNFRDCVKIGEEVYCKVR